MPTTKSNEGGEHVAVDGARAREQMKPGPAGRGINFDTNCGTEGTRKLTLKENVQRFFRAAGAHLANNIRDNILLVEVMSSLEAVMGR